MTVKLKCPFCLRKREQREATIFANLPADLVQPTIDQLPKVKQVHILSETRLKTGTLVKYSCGHSVLEPFVEVTKNPEYLSLTKGYEAYEYQKVGVEFGVASNYNWLCADEMGLGKTVQALLAYRRVAKTIGRAIFVVPSNTFYQWVGQFKEWCSQDGLALQPIVSSANPILPVFDAYLVSMDLLPTIVEKLLALNPQIVIADEIQYFKNPRSARSQALVELIQKGRIPHKIFLSGTPIKNRAGEYFTILNLLAPGHFPSWKSYCTRWLEPERTKNGAIIYRRLRKYAIDSFRELTAKWIIRRETAEVAPDLPPIRFNYQEVEITDPTIKKSYNAQLDLFANWLQSGGPKSNAQLLGWLAKLRHETEFAKVPAVTEIAKDFLDSTEESNAKLAIGIHHVDVRDNLHFNLEPYGALKLSGENSPAEKQIIKERFWRPENRVLVINEQSGGVGTDGLQVCNNVFIVARQWSPTDEEQFVKRFNRDRSNLVRDGIMTQVQAAVPTYVTVLMAHNTIDVFFHQQSEDKKAILKEAYGNWNLADDTESLMELAQTVIEHRL